MGWPTGKAALTRWGMDFRLRGNDWTGGRNAKTLNALQNKVGARALPAQAGIHLLPSVTPREQRESPVRTGPIRPDWLKVSIPHWRERRGVALVDVPTGGRPLIRHSRAGGNPGRPQPKTSNVSLSFPRPNPEFYQRRTMALEENRRRWIPVFTGMTEWVAPGLGALDLGCKVPGFPFSRECTDKRRAAMAGGGSAVAELPPSAAESRVSLPTSGGWT